jgi:hypothetical protein
MQRPTTSSAAYPTGSTSPPSTSPNAYEERDSAAVSRFSGVASNLKKRREVAVSNLVEKLRDLTEHTKKDLKKAEFRLRGAKDGASSFSAGDSREQSVKVNGNSSARDITHPVTVLSMGSESFVGEGASSRFTKGETDGDVEEEDYLHRSQINSFIEMSRSKSLLFTDPGRHEEMRRTRSFKDNRIVSSLKGAAPGFLSREDRMFDFDGKDLEKGLFNHEKEVISGLYQPKTYDFLHGKAASSAIEVVPR